MKKSGRPPGPASRSAPRSSGLWRDSVSPGLPFHGPGRFMSGGMKAGGRNNISGSVFSGCHVAEADGLVIGGGDRDRRSDRPAFGSTNIIAAKGSPGRCWTGPRPRSPGAMDRAELYCYVPQPKTALALYQKRGYVIQGQVRDENSGLMKHRLTKNLAVDPTGPA